MTPFPSIEPNAYLAIVIVFWRAAAPRVAGRTSWQFACPPNSTSPIRIWAELEPRGEGGGRVEVMTPNFDPIFRTLTQLRSGPNSVAGRAL